MNGWPPVHFVFWDNKVIYRIGELLFVTLDLQSSLLIFVPDNRHQCDVIHLGFCTREIAQGCE